MAEKNLAGMRVAILATQNFEQSELTDPRQALEEAGATIRVIAPKSGEIQGVKHDEKGEKIAVDLTLDKADPEDFDAVLLPGGALNADHLRVEPRRRNLCAASTLPASPSP